MEYMLFSTNKYKFFQYRNLGIWALPIPEYRIEKNVRDPGIPGLQFLVGIPPILPLPLTPVKCNFLSGTMSTTLIL